MTYDRLQSLTTGFLIGDNKLPSDPDVLLALLEAAFVEVSTLADSLHLMTVSTNVNALRMGPTTLVESTEVTSTGTETSFLEFKNEYLIRFPELPVVGTDEIDIDQELCVPVARLLASYISKEKGGIHKSIALRMILDYNAKVYDILSDKFNDTIAEFYSDSTDPIWSL